MDTKKHSTTKIKQVILIIPTVRDTTLHYLNTHYIFIAE